MYLTSPMWECVWRVREWVIISSLDLVGRALWRLLQQTAYAYSKSGESMVTNRNPLSQAELITVISKEWILISARAPPGNLYKSVLQKIIEPNHLDTKLWVEVLGGRSLGKSLIFSAIREVDRAPNHLQPGEFFFFFFKLFLSLSMSWNWCFLF